MSLNNLYNFKNPVRHFLDIDSVIFPADHDTFNIEELSWTKPVAFRVRKEGDKYRTLKMPNILSFERAYQYYKGLVDFNTIENMDIHHKRISVNFDTGDFKSGEYDLKLNQDFMALCLYDCLLRLDIKEYYGKIYTHYLGWDTNGLEDFVLSSMNNGKTSGLLMGNYLSLYFAEYMLSQISLEINSLLNSADISCKFEYFSDDFYFFCNKRDMESIIKIFDKALEKFDFERKLEKGEVWDYEQYNKYNILTRYWKATIRHWNLEFLKDAEIAKKHKTDPTHRLVFLNQIIYRIDSLPDEKSKRTFINNFFKTRHFQEADYTDYSIKEYDYHQLCYLLKLCPEALLYTVHVLETIGDFDKNKMKGFLKARYKVALENVLNDEQLYYYYALKYFKFDDILKSFSALVADSNNQIIISYYLKDGYFSSNEIGKLKTFTGEEYWLQNYHLILYNNNLYRNLNASIKTYLIPERAIEKNSRKKIARYRDFYKENLTNKVALVDEISGVKTKIEDYLNLRYEETAVDFEDEI